MLTETFQSDGSLNRHLYPHGLSQLRDHRNLNNSQQILSQYRAIRCCSIIVVQCIDIEEAPLSSFVIRLEQNVQTYVLQAFTWGYHESRGWLVGPFFVTDPHCCYKNRPSGPKRGMVHVKRMALIFWIAMGCSLSLS